jgi:hypothetical protein
MARQRVVDGWVPTLLTFTFDQVPGERSIVMKRMIDEVERVYRTFLTRVVRNPVRDFGEVPLLIGGLDLPVLKHGKVRLSAHGLVNDGLHAHGVLLMPSVSRLKTTAADHFEGRQRLYVRAGKPLTSLHAKPIESNVRGTTDYALKSLKNGRLSYEDALIILPRATTELG